MSYSDTVMLEVCTKVSNSLALALRTLSGKNRSKKATLNSLQANGVALVGLPLHKELYHSCATSSNWKAASSTDRTLEHPKALQIFSILSKKTWGFSDASDP
ncbi:Uncharacterized protein TCM_035927 [Theobroma cacao]|uniref:Uncharacterized protein n=1 Tax=Theobroma cacao TaxID=3641 RepID=A0A061FIK1_THECC|nr:Uncharacterized protein TCM_035927 [Theobroma cacao]